MLSLYRKSFFLMVIGKYGCCLTTLNMTCGSVLRFNCSLVNSIIVISLGDCTISIFIVYFVSFALDKFYNEDALGRVGH